MSPELEHRIVIPGGAGLVGQNLIAQLKRRGYRHLVVLDKHESNLNILQRLHPEVLAVCVDLAQAGSWADHFRGAAAVVMLQAQIGGLEQEAFLRNNLRATENILQAIRQHGVPYLVHVSSSVTESVANDHYSNTKREQERLVIDSGIAAVVLRPTLMFGWFDRKHLGWLSRFMRRVPVFPIPGHGAYLRQPLYAGDFAHIVVACIGKRPAGQTFNITGLEKVRYIDIIREIKRATRAPALILRIPYGLFRWLLRLWSVFDRDPPFTVDQLQALVAPDEFEVIDWPRIFGVTPTPFAQAIEETFGHPVYSKIVLDY